MNVMALKGFSTFGRLDEYIDTEKAFCPRKYNWTESDAGWLLKRMRKRFNNTPISVWGFSDGGTLAHELAQYDNSITSLIVHSGMFRPMTIRRRIPTLLLITNGDRTPTYHQTIEAFHYYKANGYGSNVSLVECFTNHRIKHCFGSGLQTIRRWFEAIHLSPAPLRNDTSVL